MGVCHFREDMSPPLDLFLTAWNCTGSGRGFSILVVGGSHAADKAAALKLNGVDVGQMTGAGCSVVPSRMSRTCRQMFDEILQRQVQTKQYETIILATQQLDLSTGDSARYTAEDVDEAIEFWKPMGGELLWLSDMPEFTALEDRKAENLLVRSDAMSGSYPVTIEQAHSNFDFMHSLERGRFSTLDSASLYCAITAAEGGCLPFVEGRGWVALPVGHLTALGAHLFGEQLLRSPPLRGFASALAPWANGGSAR